jgi:hypothetical protein
MFEPNDLSAFVRTKNLITIGFEILKLILTEVNHQSKKKMQEKSRKLLNMKGKKPRIF